MGDDREGMIYAPGQNWVTREEVIGRARGLVMLWLFLYSADILNCGD